MNDSRSDHPDLDALLRQAAPDDADRLREVWRLAGPDEPTAFPGPQATEAALRRLRRTTTDRLPGASRPPRTPARAARPHLRRYRMLLLAAAAVVALLLGVAWWMQPVTQTAPFGQRLAVELPDGSRAELNSGTSLRYARRFGAERRVVLVGEAFFDVAEDAGRPFLVETHDAVVQVLGTRFGVRAWPGEPEGGTAVAVESGRVLLAPAAAPAQSVTLAAGAAWRIGAAGTAEAEAQGGTVGDAIAWRRGDLVFRDRPLAVILADVERRFAVQVQVDPATVRQRRFSVELRQPPSAEAVVRDLAGALGLHYRETADGYALSVE